MTKPTCNTPTDNTPISYKPAELITHRPPMLLIDHIDQWGNDWLECLVDHLPGCSFADNAGKIPTWLCLEYMCQAIAALEGIQRLAKAKPIAMGFVMGCKRLEVNTPHFYLHQRIRVRVEEEMKNQTSLGVYSCQITDFDEQSENNKAVLAHATIKAIMPENPESLLNLKRRNN